MKIKITVEYDVNPGRELNSREQTNVVGMLKRLTRNRLQGFVGQRLGGEHSSTGWEVHVQEVTLEPVTKS